MMGRVGFDRRPARRLKMNLVKRVNLSGEDPYSLKESSEKDNFREIKWNRENLSSLYLTYKAKDFFIC